MGAFLVSSSVEAGTLQDVTNAAGWVGAAVSVPLGAYGTYKGYTEA